MSHPLCSAAPVVEQVNRSNGTDLFYWRMTTGKKPVKLAEFSPENQDRERIFAVWTDTHKNKKTELIDRVTDNEKTEPLEGAVDLEQTGFGAVTKHRTYSGWLTELTDQQRKFFEHPVDRAVKLRGPAGSGKTLLLELKALKELYEAEDDDTRIAFVTHSWAIAEHIDAGLRQLDEQGIVGSMDVFPLLAIARAQMPSERDVPGVQLLGEDSLSGRRLQLEKIREIALHLREGDWLAYRNRVSDDFRERVESEPDSAEFWALTWDLMNEFASVLSAQGILPGVNAEERYVQLDRTKWMMPLTTKAEKRVVFRVYEEYLTQLKKEGYITTDQVINDFINYLETFAWDFVRNQKGYDYIFVDELHLFNDQERLALHYLTRDPNQYP